MRTKVTASIKDKDSQWSEPFYLDGIVTKQEAIERIQNIIVIFNSSLRPTESPRKLVEVTELINVP